MKVFLLSLLALILSGFQLFAQSRITGKILDSKTKESLIGATVLVKGTTIAASASLDGTFKLTIPAPGSGVLVFSYIGYVSKEVAVSESKNIGTILLESNSSALSEVVVTGDVAIDRKTPIAVSTINAQFIEEKLGSGDLPELLKGTPSVQVTAQGGGFGDSRINIRGFQSGSKNGNVALTINGIPVNDMENGSIFWSNWSGLTDVTQSMQIQRGLGASKIIVPSFGGTINITTRSTDVNKGGNIAQVLGSDGYTKTSASFSSGLDKNGWAVSFAGNRQQGNGNADGLQYLGYAYFFNLSKVISKTQSLSFNFMGATQTHGQRYQNSIDVYRNAPQGIRYNSNWGIKDGQIVNPSQNFFSKPLASLTHHWTLNETSDISTVVYATIGKGGGESLTGTPSRIGDQYSPYDFTAVEKQQASTPDNSASTYFKASHNDHYWYGARSTYSKTFANALSLSTGLDLRYYQGVHYTQIEDLLGASYYLDRFTGTATTASVGSTTGDINNPYHFAKVGDKVSFYNKDNVISGGAFLQTEYTKDNLNVFITLSGTGTGDKRIDYFNYLNSDPRQSSPYVRFFTYQAKGGANYNINSQNNVFANIGYITKPPYFDNVFLRFTNTINGGTVPEKLFSYELGYGFKSPVFNANVNVYRSTYSDRAFATSFLNNNVLYSANISGINELHQGVELDMRYRPLKGVTVGGMLSIGDWYYTQDTGPVSVFNDQQVLVSTVNSAHIKGIKVGDAAQTTAALSLDFDVLPSLKLGANYNYYANYTANFVASNLTSATVTSYTPYKMPAYQLLDLNGVFRFKFGNLDGSFIGTVHNVFNTAYFSDSLDPLAAGSAAGVTVYYGLGRTFTTGVKIKF